MAMIRLATLEERNAARNLFNAVELAEAKFEQIWKREIDLWRNRDSRVISVKRHGKGEYQKRRIAYIDAATRSARDFYHHIHSKPAA